MRDLHGSRHAPALLDMIADTAVDADYAVVADRRASGETDGGHGAPGAPGAPGARDGLGSPGVRLVALLLLGLLIATGLVQTARSEPAARQGRAELLEQLDAGADALATRRTRIAALQRDLSRLDAQSASMTLDAAVLRARSIRAARLAEAEAVSGPGLVVTVSDAPGATTATDRVLDKDLQRLVNGLWAAGAEAIAVDGVRLTALSSIRTAGEAITVDYRSVRSPYPVSVIGDANELQTRFLSTTHGRYWYELTRSVGITLDFAPRGEVEVPAARRLGLRQARPLTAAAEGGSS